MKSGRREPRRLRAAGILFFPATGPIAALSACLMMTGCALTSGTKGSNPSAAPAPALRTSNVNLAGYPPAFRQGYGDGCATAVGRATRDEARFKADVQYAWGWRDGNDICGRR